MLKASVAVDRHGLPFQSHAISFAIKLHKGSSSHAYLLNKNIDMRIKHILPLLLFPLLLQGQPSPWFYFELGDTLTVIAKSGLTLRDSSAAGSKKIGTLPFGQKLIAIGNYEGVGVFENRLGSWLKVKHGKSVGYVFSGFVTRLKIPTLRLDESQCYNLAWFEQLARANVGKLACKGEKTYKGFDLDGKDWGRSVWEIYQDETVIRHAFGYESEDIIIESTTITMNEVLNLLEFYIEKIKGKCPDAYYMREGNKLGIDIKKDGAGHILSIECFDMDFIAERSAYKTVIKLNLWNL